MLQRVQTIFMFIAATSMIAMAFLPLWEKADPKASRLLTMNAYEIKLEQQNTKGEMKLLDKKRITPISIGVFVAAVIMLSSIFCYKNRMTQIKLNLLFSLMVIGVIIGTTLYIPKANQILNSQLQGSYLLGFYLPIIALLNNFIANRFIRKDEVLVKSADRIR